MAASTAGLTAPNRPAGHTFQRGRTAAAIGDRRPGRQNRPGRYCYGAERHLRGRFLGFSYGFRPRRGAHNALDALAVGIDKRKVNYILDADIRSFFDSVSQKWLVRFVEHPWLGHPCAPAGVRKASRHEIAGCRALRCGSSNLAPRFSMRLGEIGYGRPFPFLEEFTSAASPDRRRDRHRPGRPWKTPMWSQHWITLGIC